ncbi:sugar ABC transporter permease [Angustibacter aerolatus]
MPFLITIALSFTNWNVLKDGDSPAGFAALDNYKSVFTDANLRTSVVNTVILTVGVVLFSLLVGLGLALLLDKKFPGRGLARTLLITPFLLTPIAAAMLWRYAMWDPDLGLVNGIAGAVGKLFGGDGIVSIAWTSQYPMAVLIFQLVWQWTPFMMLIILAGLQSQPGDVMEAARVDGASAWQTFRYVTLPHLRQYLELAALLGTINIVQTFDAIRLTRGGPGLSTSTLPFRIYQTMFQSYEYGLAAAQGVVVVIFTIIIATFALRVVSSLFTEEVAR